MRLLFARSAMFAAVLTAGWVVANAPAIRAQGWENVHGHQSCRESGYKGVTPVSLCGSGYIAADVTSRTGSSCGQTDAYVVRTSPAGAFLWEMRYDIGGALSSDTAFGIVELADSSGFAIVGVTDSGGVNARDIFILKIACDGSLLWSWTYGGALEDVGFDIIEAATGSAAGGTAPGDLVVAGWTFTGLPSSVEAYLLRVTSGGTVVWDQTYDGGKIDRFFALDEANLRAGQSTGDILAVGGTTSYPNGLQGLVARVNGNSGAIGASPQNVASYGGGGAETFYAIRELQMNEFASDLVMVGFSTTTFTSISDVYLAHTKADPCSLVVNVQIGDNKYGVAADTAHDVRENMEEGVYGGPGFVVITGATDTMSIGTSTDAFLVTTTPVTTWTAAPGRLFGGKDSESGRSLFIDPGSPSQPSGVIVAGNTRSNLESANPADPEDLYLFKTNVFLETTCEVLWRPTTRILDSIEYCPTPTTSTLGSNQDVLSDDVAINFRSRVCTAPTTMSIRAGAPTSIDLDRPSSQREAPQAGIWPSVLLEKRGASAATVRIWSSRGDLVSSSNVSLGLDTRLLRLTEGRLAPGLYFALVMTDLEIIRRVFVIVD